MNSAACGFPTCPNNNQAIPQQGTCHGGRDTEISLPLWAGKTRSVWVHPWGTLLDLRTVRWTLWTQRRGADCYQPTRFAKGTFNDSESPSSRQFRSIMPFNPLKAAFCPSGADRGGWSFHAHDDASRGPKNPEIPIRSLFLSPVVRLEFLCRLSAYWWGDADLHLGADSRKAPLVCTAHLALPAPRSIRSSDQ